MQKKAKRKKTKTIVSKTYERITKSKKKKVLCHIKPLAKWTKKRFFTSFNEWHPTPPPNPASVVHVKSLVDYGNTKTPACTLGWVARLCCSWLSLGKANLISHWDNTVVKSDNEKKVLGLDSLISSSTCLE